jgi:hypothetical protein
MALRKSRREKGILFSEQPEVWTGEERGSFSPQQDELQPQAEGETAAT